MYLSNIVNQFLDDYGFADASTTERTDFTTSHEGADQVNNFDTCLEEFD